MKGSKIAISVGGLVLLSLGMAMAVTNPDEGAYREYASGRLTEYVKENVCQKAPFIEARCASLVDNERSRLTRAIADSTQQHNFVFFSLYTTEVSLNELVPAWIATAVPALPSYQFETVGVFQNFYTYRAKKQ